MIKLSGMTEDRSEPRPTSEVGRRPYAAPFFRRLDVNVSEGKPNNYAEVTFGGGIGPVS